MKIIAFKPLIYFILLNIMLVTQSFIYERTSNRTEINKKLLIGRWLYKNSHNQQAGKITIIFNEDGTGLAMFDSPKSVYKFKYTFKNDSIIKLSSGENQPDFHLIKLLNNQVLKLRAYPFKQIGESIDLIDTDYKRIN